MSTIYICNQILSGLTAIAAAGHGIEIDSAHTGGNSHTNTMITICCRKSGSGGFAKKLKVKHTSSYSGRFSEWSGISNEFGELCYAQLSTIDDLVKKATELA